MAPYGRREVRFEREPLYEEVWTTPIRTLAAKYGLSDNGLRKVCKAMNIPVPPVGYWQKLEAGHHVFRPKLPEECDHKVFISYPPEQHRSEEISDEDQLWLKEKLSFEEQPANRIVVPNPVVKWHRLVMPIRSELLRAVKETQQWEKEDEKKKRESRPIHPQVLFPTRWETFLRDGQLLTDAKSRFPLRVTSKTLDLALSIANEFLLSAEKRGFKVESEHGRFAMILLGHKLSFRITERAVENLSYKAPRGTYEFNVTKARKPTGQLRIYIGHTAYSDHGIEGTASIPIQERLNQAFSYIYRRIVRERAEERRREIEREEGRARDRERARLQAIKDAERKQEETEAKHRNALYTEAAEWQKADLIRTYVGQVEASLTHEQKEGLLKGWIVWALQVADELDPTIGRILDPS